MEKIVLENPWIIILVLLWTLPWKAAALWRAARRGHIGWFLTIVILNTLAILDILYIFIFSKWRDSKVEQIEKTEKPQQFRSWQQLGEQKEDLEDGYSEEIVRTRQADPAARSRNRSSIV